MPSQTVSRSRSRRPSRAVHSKRPALCFARRRFLRCPRSRRRSLSEYGCRARFSFSSRAAWHWSRLAVHTRQSPPVYDGIVYDTLRRLERVESVGTPTAIVASRHAMEPGVIGIRRPVLIWPQHLTAGLTDTQIEAIVGHEMCHIVRRDNMLALVQIVVSAVFWFYPLVWWIGARLVDERERACDERVLSAGQCPGTYAESILKTCRLCIASPVVNVPGVTGGDLKQRIVRIVKNEPARPLDARRKTALLVAALVLLLLPTAAGVSACVPRRSDEAPKEAQVVPVPAPSPDDDREVNRPGRNITTPRLIREAKPKYTARAIQERVQGEVLMECVVKADGTVGDTKVVKALHPDLDQAALDAAAQWVFEPGRARRQTCQCAGRHHDDVHAEKIVSAGNACDIACLASIARQRGLHLLRGAWPRHRRRIFFDDVARIDAIRFVPCGVRTSVAHRLAERGRARRRRRGRRQERAGSRASRRSESQRQSDGAERATRRRGRHGETRAVDTAS